ncbi:hypothetical protein C3942_21830, partial [Solimonas fluminis]
RADAKAAADASRLQPTPKEAVATYTALSARMARARKAMAELEAKLNEAARVVYVVAGPGVKIMGESVVYVGGTHQRPCLRVDAAKVIG